MPCDSAALLCTCTVGIGRTGTFCAVDILLQWFDHWQECSAEAAGPDDAEVEAAVGVPNLVHKLRGQRMVRLEEAGLRLPGHHAVVYVTVTLHCLCDRAFGSNAAIVWVFVLEARKYQSQTWLL